MKIGFVIRLDREIGEIRKSGDWEIGQLGKWARPGQDLGRTWARPGQDLGKTWARPGHDLRTTEKVEDWEGEMICRLHCPDDYLGKHSLSAIWSFTKQYKDGREAFLKSFQETAGIPRNRKFGVTFIKSVCREASRALQSKISTEYEHAQLRLDKKQRRVPDNEHCCTLYIPHNPMTVRDCEGVCARCQSQLSLYFRDRAVGLPQIDCKGRAVEDKN
ncbi:MAG: hypothetical protein Q9157_002772 [Trypethelium eluteriae]